MEEKELKEKRNYLRKYNNSCIELNILREQLKILNKSCNYTLELEENRENILAFNLKWINKKNHNIEKITGFFDETEVLTYIKALSEYRHFKN